MNEKDVINKYLDQIISVLDNKASQLHKILHEASDIDDFEKSQHIWFGVRQKLEKIKQLKNNIIDMKAHELLSEIFDEETELSVVHNTVNTAVALEDKSNDSDTDIDNSQNNTEIKDEQLGAEYSSTCELNTDNVNESWMSLTDDLTWGKVKKLYFDHKKYLVKDFTEAFVKLHELLYDRDREKFLEMMNEKFVNTDKKKHISTNDRFKYPGDEHNYYKKMNNTNIYVWVNKSNSNKARFIIKMLNYFDIPCDSVKLLVENIDTNNKSNNVDIFSTFDENEAENEKKESPIYENITDTPYRITINDKIYKVKNWGDMLVKVLEYLILRDPYDMTLYIVDSDKFTRNKNDACQSMEQPYKLNNGYWIDIAVDKNNALDLIYEAIEKCEYPKDYIEIE